VPIARWFAGSATVGSRRLRTAVSSDSGLSLWAVAPDTDYLAA
jgi:hypothetical protein